ncbi:hypothetical protein AVEN_35718-1 [Araneus ventricosus]|uniref:Gustatory receptor n=1 Tax=Araneus ventricosus TaxID=182803 RepID=A0A4Y2PHQ7_ARAVE|nr:hypothetical protein AVEN_35718-1 [Araneus ventricosus]
MFRQAYELLSTKISANNLADAVDMILKSAKLHQNIEDILSFSVFLSYVLVFVNFLNLVSVNAVDFECPFVRFRIIASVIVFLWTLFNFFKMTLIGTKIIDVCDEWKLLQKDIVRNCTKTETSNADELTCLMLVLEVTKVDIFFTGWGMFQLDRRLLLTMVEAIVTYSVLIATL